MRKDQVHEMTRWLHHEGGDGKWQPEPLHLPLDERPRRRPLHKAPPQSPGSSDSSQPSDQDERSDRVIVIDIA